MSLWSWNWGACRDNLISVWQAKSIAGSSLRPYPNHYWPHCTNLCEKSILGSSDELHLLDLTSIGLLHNDKTYTQIFKNVLDFLCTSALVFLCTDVYRGLCSGSPTGQTMDFLRKLPYLNRHWLLHQLYCCGIANEKGQRFIAKKNAIG